MNNLAVAQVDDLTMEQLQILGGQVMAAQLKKMQSKVEQLSDEVAKSNAELTIAKHRIDNLDATNIDGDLRQRLNNMIRKYSFDKGIGFNNGWKDFTTRFNLAYHKNLVALTNNLSERKGKQVTRPETLEHYGLLEDAIRVADKMING